MPKGLPKAVLKSLEKSRDASLLAVETYNKPAVKFKSGGYIIMMVIAWTSLFHAIFFMRKIKPFYRIKGSVRFDKKDGDYCYWELATCLKEYYKTDGINPVRKNLEFFIPLRNIIEHKSLPEIDSDIFAECQSLLLNYDDLLGKEFGEKFRIRESLSFTLQLFPNSKNLSEALKQNPDAKRAIEFINSYRSSLSTDIFETGQYAFKAFLLQISNHNSKDALPIQFIKYDALSEEEKKNVKRVAALVKISEKPVANHGLLLPGDVVKMVQKNIGNPKIAKNGKEKDKFNQDAHTRCWKKYVVRPQPQAGNPANTDSQYCIYNALNKNYGYTQAWVDFLSKEMKEEDKFNALYE